MFFRRVQFECTKCNRFLLLVLRRPPLDRWRLAKVPLFPVGILIRIHHLPLFAICLQHIYAARNNSHCKCEILRQSNAVIDTGNGKHLRWNIVDDLMSMRSTFARLVNKYYTVLHVIPLWNTLKFVCSSNLKKTFFFFLIDCNIFNCKTTLPC